MNTTGCPAFFARDDLLAMDPFGTNESPCNVMIPLYAVLLAVFTLILGAVALSRTKYILRRVYSNSGVTLGAPWRGRLGWPQILTISQSWLSCINSLLLLIVPLAYGSGNNIVVVLFGVQNVLNAISSERWLTKLIRLGSKIIGKPNQRSSKQLANSLRPTRPVSSSTVSDVHGGGGEEAMPEQLLAMVHLERFDIVLYVMMTSLRLVTIFLLISLCVLPLVFPSERRWLLGGLGAQSYHVFASLAVFLYQYHRCKAAMIITQKHIHAMLKNDPDKALGSDDGLRQAIKKFSRHQLILTMTGCPGGVIFLLWAISVLPVNHSTILVGVFFDVLVNGSMFFTFKPKRKSRQSKRLDRQELQQIQQQQQSAVVVAADHPQRPDRASGGPSESHVQAVRGSTMAMVSPTVSREPDQATGAEADRLDQEQVS